MCPPIVSGILTGDALVSYWPFFFYLSLTRPSFPVEVYINSNAVRSHIFDTFLSFVVS